MGSDHWGLFLLCQPTQFLRKPSEESIVGKSKSGKKKERKKKQYSVIDKVQTRSGRKCAVDNKKLKCFIPIKVFHDYCKENIEHYRR